MRLPTTVESTSVNACWAPSDVVVQAADQSPVCARVKKASGMRCTWEKTLVRRSKTRPSPTRAET